MATLIFRLRQVPEEEAGQVRELLEQHAIEYYETSAGNWGISMPGLWVADEQQAHRARVLIDEHQRRLVERHRAHVETLRRDNRAPGLVDRLRTQPLPILAVLLFCLFIVYITVAPLFGLIAD